MDKGIKIRAMSAPWHNGVELLIKQGNKVGVEIIMKEYPEHTMLEPTVTIGLNEAQVLMDDLWAAGIRPTEGSGSAGALRATEKHLNDMRKIAFKILDINKED